MTRRLLTVLLLCLFFFVFLVGGSCRRAVTSSSSTSGRPDTAAIRSNNLGVAEMNRGRTTQALDLFRQAFRRDPSLLTARLNEGIALLNTQRFMEARTVLLEATRQQPDSARAWYNLGILYRNLSEVDDAIGAFTRVTQLDSGDADALYFLGQLHAQAMRYPEAISWYTRSLALAAQHASAEFGLARAYQLSGNEDEARRHLARFDELSQSGLGKPISLIYGEQGPYSTAEPVAGIDMAPAEFRVRLSPVASALGTAAVAQPAATNRPLPVLGSGACFLDFDADARFDLLLLGGRSPLLYRNTGGQFTDVSGNSGLSATGNSVGCTVGDFDNDNRDDVAIGFENRVALFRNQGSGMFQDVTAASGIRSDGLPLSLTFVDYDHDGDIDLYVSRFSNVSTSSAAPFDLPFGPPAPANQLWRNNGNGTFTNWTTESGLGGDAPGIAALPGDFNNDRAVDFILTAWRPAPIALTNSREGPFRASDMWRSAFPAPAAGVVSLDYDKDGWMDLAFTHWGAPGLSIWRNLAGTGFGRLAITDPPWSRGWGITVVDIDNDGWLDLVALGETVQAANATSHLLILRNLGGRFSDVTQTVWPDSSLRDARALLSGDIDNDGDSDLLITQNGASPVVLRNDGGTQRRAVRLAFQGLSDNRSAIGTKVEVFAGALRQKWEVVSSSGYLGQNAPGILAGVDEEREADIVRVLWPTGVPQDEVQLGAGQRTLIKEIDRRGSSCPVVFVWDGSRYQFVSDIIGPGIIGEWLEPGERNIPDPNEYLKIDGSRIKLKNGRLSFRFAEVMEEITYLDHVRLLAVDHPADVVVNPNEYFPTTLPLPQFKVITTRNPVTPKTAVDDSGKNVLPELLKRDGRYVTGFDSLPYAGYTETHYLDLDLGGVNTQGPLRLIMHGFIDYFTVTSIFAAHQGDVHAVAPFLDVRAPDGSWKRIADDIGFPAGLARTMVSDLTGKLPPGTSRVRIGTNLKIYWDQILIDTTPQTTPVELHEIPAVEAALAFRGYPRRVEGSVRGDLSYVHDDVSLTGPFSRARGHYTEYGNVLSLLMAADDRFTIIGSGDEVSLEFDPSGLPGVRPGWVRDYFLYADGFAKDMDFYSAYSHTVEPLPFHAMGQYPYGPEKRFPDDTLRLNYRLRTNTRASGDSDYSKGGPRYLSR